jgi:hypothetical protein
MLADQCVCTSGVGRHLLCVELAARGVEVLLAPDVWIAKTLVLPFFWRDSGPVGSRIAGGASLEENSSKPNEKGPSPQSNDAIL